MLDSLTLFPKNEILAQESFKNLVIISQNPGMQANSRITFDFRIGHRKKLLDSGLLTILLESMDRFPQNTDIQLQGTTLIAMFSVELYAQLPLEQLLERLLLNITNFKQSFAFQGISTECVLAMNALFQQCKVTFPELPIGIQILCCTNF